MKHNRHQSSPDVDQQTALGDVLRLLLQHAPGAAGLVLRRLKDSARGFAVYDVVLSGDGRHFSGLLSTSDAVLLLVVQEALAPGLRSLEWHGVIGENRLGEATLEVNPVS